MIHNGEYYPLIKAFGGQALNISTNTDTHINPFDSSLQYAKNDKEAIKEKSEFILAFIESIVNGLSGEQKTLTDVVRIIFMRIINSIIIIKNMSRTSRNFIMNY